MEGSSLESLKWAYNEINCTCYAGYPTYFPLFSKSLKQQQKKSEGP